MAKSKAKALDFVKPARPKKERPSMTVNQQRASREAFHQEAVYNEVLYRRTWLKSIIDQRRDIDNECGYPDEVTSDACHDMFTRNGIAARVVSVYPEECWKKDPEIYEKEDTDEETTWEQKLAKIIKKFALFTFLERADILSGVGRYGGILVGLDDGQELLKPAFEIDAKGLPVPSKGERNITFLRCFTDRQVEIAEYEKDEKSPRFGDPTFYNIKFADMTTISGRQIQKGKMTSVKVHWTRFIHLADERTVSEIIGGSRLENVFNFFLDFKKVCGGSAEMFWKGGYPGLSFEVDPTLVGQAELDKDSIKQEMEDYSSGQSRYLSTVGVKVNSLEPGIASPKDNFDIIIDSIAAAKAIPKRVLLGSERGELASTQDKESWNERLMRRQNRYIIPFIIMPTIERFMALGVLPLVEEFFVAFPDLQAPSEKDIAEIAERMVKAMALYMTSGADELMAPLDFLMRLFKMTKEEAEAVLKAAEERVANEERFADQGLDDQERMIDAQAKAKSAETGPQSDNNT